MINKLIVSNILHRPIRTAVSALAVAIEARPCHIASLPVAVNIQCHASRHQEVVL